MKRSATLFISAALVALSALMFTACGGDDGTDAASQQLEIEKAKLEAAAEQKAKDKAEQLEQEVAALKKKVNQKAKTKTVTVPSGGGSSSGGGGSMPGGTTSCGGSVSAGPNTSCAFAQSVASEYFGSGGGSGTVTAYSSVTQKYYTMTCTAGAPTVCRGGNNASVYIR